MKTQEEITLWENQHSDKVTGWQISYSIESDEIVFQLSDKTKQIFQRLKTI